MDKERKTYVATGLLDFKMALSVGGAIIRICFSGGSMGANGVIPAKYTTDNPVIIKIIEDSKQFKSRRITLQRTERLNNGKDEKGEKGHNGVVYL